jgi:chaperonin GroES
MSALDGNTIQDLGASKIPEQAVIPIPLGDKVIVVQDEARKMINKLYIPDTQTDVERPFVGTVMAVGSGRYDTNTNQLVPMSLIVGDRVAFSRFAGYDVIINNQEAKVMIEYDIHFRLPRLGENGYEQYQAHYAAELAQREKENQLVKQTAATGNLGQLIK